MVTSMLLRMKNTHGGRRPNAGKKTPAKVDRLHPVYLFKRQLPLSGKHARKLIDLADGVVQLSIAGNPETFADDVRELTEATAALITITDGNAEYSAYCTQCGRRSMQVVRPGKVQCAVCG